MERLTKLAVHKTGNKYVSAIGSGHGAWPRIIQRLAAYEDTGREPEELRWIPVTEQLPIEWKEYIVMIKGATRPTTLYFNPETVMWYEIDDGVYPVTHWMPLPAPPKEV